MTDTLTLTPGNISLPQWRQIYRGAGIQLDASTHTAIQRSAQAVDAIIAAGAPVYGINTGFGKLASVRIEPNDLATLHISMHYRVARCAR